jgi:hypothetical protein
MAIILLIDVASLCWKIKLLLNQKKNAQNLCANVIEVSHDSRVTTHISNIDFDSFSRENYWGHGKSQIITNFYEISDSLYLLSGREIRYLLVPLIYSWQIFSYQTFTFSIKLKIFIIIGYNRYLLVSLFHNWRQIFSYQIFTFPIKIENFDRNRIQQIFIYQIFSYQIFSYQIFTYLIFSY